MSTQESHISSLCPLRPAKLNPLAPAPFPLSLFRPSPLLLLTFFFLGRAAAQKSSYCGPNWSSYGPSSKFVAGPCLQISGIGITQSPQKSIYVIDRSDLVNTYAHLPGSYNGTSKSPYAYAEELDLGAGVQRPLDIVTDTFCSTGQFLPNGSFVSIGGHSGGASSVRLINPGQNFQIVASLTSHRWYPTSQILPDGRVLVVGGSLVGVDMNRGSTDNPSLEYYPQQPGPDGKGVRFRVDFLSKALPYNLYPYVHLLPSGNVFVFAGDSYILWNTGSNKQVGDPKSVGFPGLFHSYPLSGTSVLFPLSPGNKFTAEIMICGGGWRTTKPTPGKTGNPWGAAHKHCHRIQPEAENPQWQMETMRSQRVMPNAVLLPDGSVLIINGASSGYAGIPNFSQGPVLAPEIYNPRINRWSKKALVSSKVPRLYHASALLLHDGSVFVSGSNPNSGIKLNQGMASTTFETEFFYPPYLMGAAFPKIFQAPDKVKVGKESFDIHVQAGTGQLKWKVVLCQPGFSTHGNNHGMRNVELGVVRVKGSSNYTLTVKSPPNLNIAPPTFYWLFVLANGIPNRDGHFVLVSG